MNVAGICRQVADDTAWPPAKKARVALPIAIGKIVQVLVFVKPTANDTDIRMASRAIGSALTTLRTNAPLIRPKATFSPTWEKEVG